MASWRVAASLLALRDQVNLAWPGRSRASDGTIGDARHRSRDSDHNPWIEDGAVGVVSALDLTHDRAGGCDMEKVVEAVRASRDRRIKYIIWNRRICSSSAVGNATAWAWRAYGGSNPHDKHAHFSVKASKALYDNPDPWSIGARATVSDPLSPEIATRPVLRRDSRSAAVSELQTLLRRHGHDITVDGRFGAATEAAVIAFQTALGLVPDGVVGQKTWAALLAA